jgi:TATA-binding protein-associated factor Taf7
MKKILEQEINKLSTNIENFTTNMDKTNKEQLKDELKNSITRLQKYQENLRTQL